VIIDNAQGFYEHPYGIASCYSPRKFFGAPDGGYLVCDKKLTENIETDTSYQRFSHLVKRIDCGSNFAYEDFKKHEESLRNEEIKQMSNLTNKILQNIDYEKAKERRLTNFCYLEKHLSEKNEFKFEITDDVPMYYPFLYNSNTLRSKLIGQNIYTPCCWNGMEIKLTEKMRESYLQKYMFPLIIDQRYSLDNMDKILQVILDEI
jgi:hypothetical protein